MNMPFKVAAMTYTYARYSLDHTLKAIASHGLSTVEIWGGHPHAAVELLNPAYLDYVNSLLKTHGLEVSMFTPEQIGAPVAIGSSNPWIQKYSIRNFCRAADGAAAMGTSRMLMTLGTLLNDEAPDQVWHRAIDSLLAIADHARNRGVTLVLEPLAEEESPLLYNLAQMKEAYSLLSPYQTEVMVDLVPMHLNGERLADYFQAFGKDLSVIHFIDCDGSTFKHLIPGTGVIQFDEILQTMKENNYTGSVSLELGNSYHQNPDDAVQKALTFLHERTAAIW